MRMVILETVVDESAVEMEIKKKDPTMFDAAIVPVVP